MSGGLSGWVAVAAAIAACYLVKLAGYLAPHGWLERPRVSRVAALVTVALLAALVAVQTLGSGRALAVDARLAAVAVAALALHRRRRAGRSRRGRVARARLPLIHVHHRSTSTTGAGTCARATRRVRAHVPAHAPGAGGEGPKPGRLTP